MQRQENPLQIDPNRNQKQKQESFRSQHMKNPQTTKLTQNTYFLQIGQSLVLGKNDLLESNTQGEFNSQAESSDISFEERLDINHQQFMYECYDNYLNQKAQLIQGQNLHQKQVQKSFESIKDIEVKILEDTRTKYGHSEFQKIKFTITYLKRNEQLAKVYLALIKRINPINRLCMYQLFKQSVLFCLNAHEKIKKQHSSISEEMIEQYVNENFSDLCQSIITDQKLRDYHYPKNNKKCQYRFYKFVEEWFLSFFLCRQGYPNRKTKKIGKNKMKKGRQGQKEQKNQIKKKLKRY